MRLSNLLFSVAFVVLGLPCSQAQSLFHKSEVKAKQTTFEIVNHDRPNYPTIAVSNKENSLIEDKNIINRYRLSGIEMQGDKTLLDIFLTVFDKERLQELVPEKRIVLIFYTDKDGKVLETAYLLDKNTAMTPQELEELEMLLKRNASFSFIIEDKQDAPFYTILKPVSFDQVLSKTLE